MTEKRIEHRHTEQVTPEVAAAYSQAAQEVGGVVVNQIADSGEMFTGESVTGGLAVTPPKRLRVNDGNVAVSISSTGGTGEMLDRAREILSS